MTYPEISRILQQEPLAILPSAHASWLARFEAFLNWRSVDREPGAGPSGSIVEREQSHIEEEIYYLPVGGPVGRNLGKMERGAGCVDFAEIIADLDEFETSKLARACVMDWDCPGGMCQGGLAVENRILACDKPIYSFSAGLLCSQAYRLACCTDGIFTTADANVGCIGVYCYALDTSKRFAEEGVKPILITSGKYKGMGVPGIPFSKDQLALLQSNVDDLAEGFYQRIEELRGADNVSREDFQGQSFQGRVAMGKGLVDGLVNDISEVAEML